MITRAVKEILELPTPSGHASTLALTGSDVLMAWFGGTAEKNPDVDIYMARRTSNGWSEPVRIAYEDNIAHWNPVFFAENEHVTLFWKVGHTIPGWHTRVMYSCDGGHSFTVPAELVPGDVGGRGPVRNKPLRLASGRILAPASIETETTWNAFTDISDDDCRTFHAGAMVPLNRPENPCGGYPVQGKGVIQPTLWQDDSGLVHMLLRSTEGFILRSTSADEGETWSPAVSSGLPNNNSGIDLTRLDDGCIALVMNPVSGNWAERSPLSLYISRDNGETFRLLMHLEINPGEYSYPCVLHEGRQLHISYTWNRRKMAYWQIDLEN